MKALCMCIELFLWYNETMLTDTIVAISTALSEAAISIVRLSGPMALDIINQLFNKDLSQSKTFTMHYGQIHDPFTGQFVDEVLVSVFRAPKTFTTEDMIEINCHGGVVVTRQILTLCLSLGARHAERGEFTQRAFLNGRIDLAQAESTLDMIQAPSIQASQMAGLGIMGSVRRLIEPLMVHIMDMIAHIETNIDYPEYTDVQELTQEQLLPRALEFKERVQQILKQAQTGQIVREGLKTVIVGKPNVGKSSLLNALLEEDKAIVTDIAGTTRDLVEGWIRLENVTLHLIDTAGLRETDEVVEKIGIDKTKEALHQAQLVIVVIDGSTNLSDDDQRLLEETKNLNRIVVYNKSDLGQLFDDGLVISAQNNLIQPLIDEINSRYKETTELINQPLLSNQRQISLMRQAQLSIEKVIEGCEMELELDLINIDLTACYKSLASILMPVDEVNVIGEIFTRFCLGK